MSLAALYPWLKAFHVASAILFAGGTLAGGMLLASASMGADASGLVDPLRRWNRLITTPAMFLVWTFGLVMASSAGWFGALWLQIKLVFVLALSALHGVQSAGLRRLEAGGTVRAGPYVWFAGACIVAIAILAVTKLA